jgi:mRNA interferase MazF
MPDAVLRRGDVWLVSFDPSLGGEVQKTRPAVILSNDTANALLNRVQVVPISSQVSRLYPAEAYVDVAGERRKAMAEVAPFSWTVCGLGSYVSAFAVCMSAS